MFIFLLYTTQKKKRRRILNFLLVIQNSTLNKKAAIRYSVGRVGCVYRKWEWIQKIRHGNYEKKNIILRKSWLHSSVANITKLYRRTL